MYTVVSIFWLSDITSCFFEGYLKVVDVETCSLVHSFLDLGSVNCLSLACIGSRPSVGVAYQLPSLTRSSLMVYGTDNDGRWHPQHVPLGEIGLQVSGYSTSSCFVDILWREFESFVLVSMKYI